MKKYLKKILLLLSFIFVVDFSYMLYSLYQVSVLSKTTFTENIVIENQKEKIKVLFHGDSVAAGIGATSLDKSAYGRFAKYLSEDFSVQFSNKSKSGNKMKDLDNEIEENYDLIVMIISSNDVLYFTPEKDFKETTEKVFDRYSKKTQKLIVVGPGKVFEAKALIKPLLPLYRYRLSIYSELLSELSSKYTNIVYVNPLLENFSKDYGKMESKDNIHPNDNGYLYWFDLIVLGWER